MITRRTALTLAGSAAAAGLLPRAAAAQEAEAHGISAFGDLKYAARWDRFGKPEKLPAYSYGFPEIWWYDSAHAAKTGTRQ